MSEYPDAAAFANTFTGTDRFAVIEQLGAGSMCVVYKVQDRKHGDVVALKTLRHLDSNSLYRLKQEFRALSHFDHPNLVSFSELVHSEQGWFVTMELVEGVDFLTFCRGHEPERESRSSYQGDTWTQGTGGSTHPASASAEMTFTSSMPAGRAAGVSAPAAAVRRTRTLPDLIRLRSGMRQLAEGVQTLHAAGRVHRDLKPSNVLVTDAGRVVILDFGLVAEIDQDYTEGTLHQNIAGSAAYMSPEQSVGKPLSEASDWYSVGVMLYEALTGVWPFSGHLYQILTMKQEEDPPPPSSRVDGVPPELEALCMGLLDRDPEKRPTGSEILSVFLSRQPAVNARKVRLQPRFRFRNPETHELVQAFQAAKWGQAVTLLVRGGQGIGKTTLVREFLKNIKRRDEVVTLKARCFEWETLPYKALDGLMDNLSRALRRLDHRQVSKLANPGLPYLSHMFPVLDRVDAFGLTEPADLQRIPEAELRQRAFEGLLQLLRELGGTMPILLFLDDVHWGDEESAVVLSEILRFSKDIPILVILAYRADERSVFVRRLLGPLQAAQVDVRTMDLDPMSFEQACVVAGEMLGLEVSDERVRRMAIESGGVPLFIKELVRQLDFQDSRANAVEEDLSEITVTEIGALPENARRLLQVMALCDQPLPTDVAMAAAELQSNAFEAITTLRAHHLVDVTGAQGGDTLEIGSEKVREYVLDRVDDSRRMVFHGRIAHAMEIRGGFAPETLVHHHAGAQNYEKAGLVAWLSADEAFKRDRVHEAIWLLDKAREYGDWNNRERRTIVSRLADAQARVGNGKAAAEAYQQAAGDAPKARARELLHRAAEELIGSGHIPEGMLILDPLMAEMGVRATSNGLFDRMRRMRMRWRGSDFTPKAEIAIPVDDLFRVDLAWTNAMGRSLVDVGRGATAQDAHLELALETGEPERAMRALAAELRFVAMQPDSAWRERYDQLLQQARGKVSHQTMARATSSAAMAALYEGAWVDAASFAESAEHMFVHHGIGAAWERFTCRAVHARAQMFRGDYRTAADLALPLVRELEQVQNDLFLSLLYSTVIAWLRMAEDDPDSGLLQLTRMSGSLTGNVGIPFFHLFVTWAHLELYKQRPQAAWEYVEERWGLTERGIAAAPPVLAAEIWWTRARCAVAMAQAGGDTSGMLKKARQSIAAVRKLGRTWTEPWMLLLEAGIARLEGGPDGVSPSLIALFEQTDQSLGSAVALHLSGAQGQERAASWMREQGIREPGKLARVLAPGLS